MSAGVSACPLEKLFIFRLTKEEDKDSTEELDVSFELDWTAYTRYFDFDTDLDALSMCDSMAREKCSKEPLQ